MWVAEGPSKGCPAGAGLWAVQISTNVNLLMPSDIGIMQFATSNQSKNPLTAVHVIRLLNRRHNAAVIIYVRPPVCS